MVRIPVKAVGRGRARKTRDTGGKVEVGVVKGSNTFYVIKCSGFRD